jgi:aminomethyltransferase
MSSHMGEFLVEGPGARAFLQTVLSNDLDKIGEGKAQYTLLTNEHGGIVDDLIAYELSPERFLLIVNAANREPDFAWLEERLPGEVELRDVSDEYALIAVQGPRALERLGLPEAPAFTFADGEVGGVACTVNRTGYTGEQGVELLAEAGAATELWDRVLDRGVVPCGLGARDTLRLEVCYPLHGNDITPETDAISAGLGWVCALDKELHRRRRAAAESRRAGPARKLSAFVMEEAGIPRQGDAIVEGREVTSARTRRCGARDRPRVYVPAELAQPGIGADDRRARPQHGGRAW